MNMPEVVKSGVGQWLFRLRPVLRIVVGPHQVPDELLALPVAVDLVTAGRAWGLGRTKAHDLARRGEFPCPALRIGNAYRVTRADLLRSLGVALAEAAGNAPQQTNGTGPAWASA